MLFNSYIFIFAFLPATFALYFYLNARGNHTGAKAFLILASLFFYGWWNPIYLPLILSSIVFNYFTGQQLNKSPNKSILTLGIIANLSLLGYFKYSDFFIQNINTITASQIPLLHLALPLAISFFTFQQVAYLVDSYKGLTQEYNALDYSLFVTFFPQLIAGPIVHHKEMMPQFAHKENQGINTHHIAQGIFIFVIGLFKKVVIADTFAIQATKGFDSHAVLGFFEAWNTSLSYTMQLYYDFSGYTDMAIGAALLFNIKLPINFNSPYKALNIQDFWHRWHITLSRFLKDYIYIPLGGNRGGEFKTYQNLMITFLLGGIWHGAGWTFLFWGFLHGGALIVHRLWANLNKQMPKLLAWFLTFNFLNIAWVFFRAKSFDDALKVLSGMFGLHGFDVSLFSENRLMLLFGAIMIIITLFAPNSSTLLQKLQLNKRYALFTGLIFGFSVLFLTRASEFLYFNF